MKDMSNEHRAPWECVYAKEHDSLCRPGEKPAADQQYFEILCLCLLQAGLNWNSIRKYWPKYKKGFFDFSIERLARAAPDDVMQNPDALKNRRKIEAIIHNAAEFERIESTHGSFAAFLEELRPEPEKERIKRLSKRFKQVGPETADYFFHSIGFRD